MDKVAMVKKEVQLQNWSEAELARAVQYALNEKRYLYGFLADSGIEISNNRAENAIRPFVVGRKTGCFRILRREHQQVRCCIHWSLVLK